MFKSRDWTHQEIKSMKKTYFHFPILRYIHITSQYFYSTKIPFRLLRSHWTWIWSTFRHAMNLKFVEVSKLNGSCANGGEWSWMKRKIDTQNITIQWTHKWTLDDSCLKFQNALWNLCWTPWTSQSKTLHRPIFDIRILSKYRSSHFKKWNIPG